MMMQTQQFEVLLSEQLAQDIQLQEIRAVHGGDINDAYKLTIKPLDSAPRDLSLEWFIKLNDHSKLEMFAAEYDGLKEIQGSQCIRCPVPHSYGQFAGNSFLLMEYIAFAQPKSDSQHQAGLQLAAMHRTLETAGRFGWHRDNTIGTTPQSNAYHHDWISFWREERLHPQLELARIKGFSDRDYKAGLQLCEQLPELFDGYEPQPSLLHGDIWGGNIAYDTEGTPVIFDPACYYGDRESDLALTELFGGFGEDFYKAYEAAFSIDQGYRQRKKLYQLYHILNHYHLFGGGYGQQAGEVIRELLRHCR